MTDDTLSQAGYLNPYVKTRCSPELRFALDCTLAEGPAATPAAHTRELLEEGLAARGWPLARRALDYAAYRADCAESGVVNVYNEKDGQ